MAVAVISGNIAGAHFFLLFRRCKKFVKLENVAGIRILRLFHTLGIQLGKGTLIGGMVYDYLPFMIYPIYNILEKMDKSYAEAAADLGATPWQVFWKVQVPLSMPGVMSGVMMVFMPTVSTFAISEFLTNNKIKLFGTIIQENINSSMWNYGAALSLVMLVIIGITSLLQDNKKEVNGVV